jgi:hypothetical protein
MIAYELGSTVLILGAVFFTFWFFQQVERRTAWKPPKWLAGLAFFGMLLFTLFLVGFLM